MKELLKILWRDENGQDLTEYALLLALISLVSIIAVKGLGSTVSTTFSSAATNMNKATS